MLLCLFIANTIYKYIENRNNRWFTDDLPSPEVVAQWTQDELDQKLHALSRWDGFTSAQFQSFVEHQIRGLGIYHNESFRYLEVGIGVGAFARHILKAYPNATGVGIDLEERVIALAKEALPLDRIHLFVGDMLKIPAISGTFDYVLVPGSLCYLHSIEDLQQIALPELSRVLRPGGGLCASMLPNPMSGHTGSCNIRVPKSLWYVNKVDLRVVSMEEMDDWHLPHSLGRYSVCLRKS